MCKLFIFVFLLIFSGCYDKAHTPEAKDLTKEQEGVFFKEIPDVSKVVSFPFWTIPLGVLGIGVPFSVWAMMGKNKNKKTTPPEVVQKNADPIELLGQEQEWYQAWWEKQRKWDQEKKNRALETIRSHQACPPSLQEQITAVFNYMENRRLHSHTEPIRLIFGVDGSDATEHMERFGLGDIFIGNTPVSAFQETYKSRVLTLDFNNEDHLYALAHGLGSRFDMVIFDYNVFYFTKWRMIHVELIKDLLKPNGKFIFPPQSRTMAMISQSANPLNHIKDMQNNIFQENLNRISYPIYRFSSPDDIVMPIQKPIKRDYGFQQEGSAGVYHFQNGERVKIASLKNYLEENLYIPHYLKSLKQVFGEGQVQIKRKIPGQRLMPFSVNPSYQQPENDASVVIEATKL